MVFCFDLDETLVKGDVITQSSRMVLVEGKCDRIYTNRDVTSWDLDGIPHLVKLHTIELFKDPKYAVLKKKPIPGVQVFLNYLKAKEHELHVLTSRPESCHAATYTYIDTIFPNIFNSITCVNGSQSSKLHELARINPDYYFDDNIGFCEESRLLGINTYIISNEYTPWNHKLLHEDIKRIKNVAFFPFEKI